MPTFADYAREAAARELSTVPRVLRSKGDLDDAVSAAFENFKKDTGLSETVTEDQIEKRLQDGDHIQRLMLLNALDGVSVPPIGSAIVALIENLLTTGQALQQWDVLIVGVSAACKEPDPERLRRLFELAPRFPWTSESPAADAPYYPSARLIPEVPSALFSGIWRLGLPSWAVKAFEHLLQDLPLQVRDGVGKELLVWSLPKRCGDNTWSGPLADAPEPLYFHWSTLEQRLIAQDLADLLSALEGR